MWVTMNTASRVGSCLGRLRPTAGAAGPAAQRTSPPCAAPHPWSVASPPSAGPLSLEQPRRGQPQGTICYGATRLTRRLMGLVGLIGHYRFINSSVLVSAGRGFKLSLPRHTRAALPMSTRRKTWRRRSLKLGLIAFKSDGTISCTVRDLSVNGACLEVVNPIGIPDDFTLVIESDQIQRRCHSGVEKRQADWCCIRLAPRWPS